MRKIVTVIGARPQFVKSGPLSKELRKKFKEVIVHSGQHYDANLSDIILRDIGSPKPDYFLKTEGATHATQTATILKNTEEVFLIEKPDAILVFGDTNTTLAAAIAASKLGIKIIHVEAGLRSFNKSMPEEINRIVTDRISDILFAPTIIAFEHLRREGLAENAYMTGDIMVDSVKTVSSMVDESILHEWDLQAGDYYLLTLHRPYNVDNKENLLNILNDLAKLDSKVVFPAHPRTQKVLGEERLPSNVKLIQPQGYVKFNGLQKYAKKIITDSGGVQKEAYLHNKPCITLRTETEWVETVEIGWNLLLPPIEGDLATKIKAFEPPTEHPNLYGTEIAKGMVKILTETI